MQLCQASAHMCSGLNVRFSVPSTSVIQNRIFFFFFKERKVHITKITLRFPSPSWPAGAGQDLDRRVPGPLWEVGCGRRVARAPNIAAVVSFGCLNHSWAVGRDC